MLTYSYDPTKSKYFPWIFIWHFYNFTWFQHCLPKFCIFFPMFLWIRRYIGKTDQILKALKTGPGEPCGSAPWGLRNTGAVCRGGFPHVFFGAWNTGRWKRVTFSESEQRFSKNELRKQLLYCNSRTMYKNVQFCWFSSWKVLSSCITYHNISQHITTYQHVVLSETFRTFRTHLTRFWRLSFRVAWRRAVPNFAPGQTAGRAAARARQDMASGALRQNRKEEIRKKGKKGRKGRKGKGIEKI